MVWICNNCNQAHGDGEMCPYIGMTPEQIRIAKMENSINQLHKRMDKIEEEFKPIKWLSELP